MQCVKLINPGFVDKVIVFDELPARLLKGAKTRKCEGFPRSWAKWLGEIGCTHVVNKTTTKKIGPGDYEYTHTPIGKEPCFYVLEYVDSNIDRDIWRHIGEYLRVNCEETVRLKEKIEDMALELARNSYEPLSVEPEDIPVIVVPLEKQEEEMSKDNVLVTHDETILVDETPKKRRGRPKKVLVA